MLGNAIEGVTSLMKYILCSAALLLFGLPCQLHAQEYSVRAIDAKSGKALKGIPITLRYDCTETGTGAKMKIDCKFIQRKTGSDGIAHFPEAGSLSDIDDIFSLPVTYTMVCCDISRPIIPGMGTITFKRLSLSQMLHVIFVGDD
jgi:hypothetical protein